MSPFDRPLRATAHATRRRRLALAVCLAVLLGAAPGCAGRAISEGIGGVRGVRGIFVPLRPVDEDLSSYERFVLGDIDDDFGGDVPEELWEAFREGFPAELVERNIPSAESGRTLIARGRIVHFETRALTGLVLGDFEEVVARIELVDEASGRVLGVANCIGRSTESVNRGTRSKGRGLARAIAAWIDDSYPDEAKPPPVEDGAQREATR